jgi:hypothetical protein
LRGTLEVSSVGFFELAKADGEAGGGGTAWVVGFLGVEEFQMEEADCGLGF